MIQVIMVETNIGLTFETSVDGGPVFVFLERVVTVLTVTVRPPAARLFLRAFFQVRARTHKSDTRLTGLASGLTGSCGGWVPLQLAFRLGTPRH